MIGKTRMIGLPHAKENVTIREAVSVQYRNATDGRTDRIAISISRVNGLKLTCSNVYFDKEKDKIITINCVN